MSYVFSKALLENDEKLKKQQLSALPPKKPPPVSCKPGTRKTPPPVKRKPLIKSNSVDTYERDRSASVDLTVLGGSEWKDFVLKRQKEREVQEAKQQELDGSRRSSSSSNTSCVTDGTEETPGEPRRRTLSTSSYTKEGANESVPDWRQFRRTSSSSGRSRLPSIDLTVVGGDEWKRISERKEKERQEEERRSQEQDVQEQTGIEQTDLADGEAKEVVPKIIDGEWKKVESPKDEEEVTQKIFITGKLPDDKEETPGSQIVGGEWKKNKEGAGTIKPELSTVTEQTSMDTKETSAPVPPVTLPKPRKIGAELKKQSFSRSSSQSKSFASSETAPVIKRSSDMMNETKRAPRGERSLSLYDTQRPYFCRLPRALSIELEETLTECEMSLKTPRSASLGNIFDKMSPVSPIRPMSEVNEELSEIEFSPDVVAMKNEIAVERSKIELERKKLSDTIDEIENIEFDIDDLIKTKSDVFEDVSQPEPISNDACEASSQPEPILNDALEGLSQPEPISNDASESLSQPELTPDDSFEGLCQSEPISRSEVKLPETSAEISVETTSPDNSSNLVVDSEQNELPVEIEIIVNDETEGDESVQDFTGPVENLEHEHDLGAPSSEENSQPLSANNNEDKTIADELNIETAVEVPIEATAPEQVAQVPSEEISEVDLQSSPPTELGNQQNDEIPISPNQNLEQSNVESASIQTQNITKEQTETLTNVECSHENGKLDAAPVDTAIDVPENTLETTDVNSISITDNGMSIDDFKSMLNACDMGSNINGPILSSEDGKQCSNKTIEEDIQPELNIDILTENTASVEAPANVANTSDETDKQSEETISENEASESDQMVSTETCAYPTGEQESDTSQIENCIDNAVSCPVEETNQKDSVHSESELLTNGNDLQDSLEMVCQVVESNSTAAQITAEPLVPSSEQETKHKSQNCTPVSKTSEMNMELVESYLNSEANGVLNGNQIESSDLKLLSEKGLSDRVIFV